MLILKNIWLWTAVDRKSKELIAFEIATKNTIHFENISEKTSRVNPKKCATECYASYNLIDPARRITGKAHNLYCERVNRLLRHYLVRFARKTYCQLKSHYMIEN